MNKESSSKFLRKFSNFTGYLTIALVFLMLVFFLVIPVGCIVARAFTNEGHFTLDYLKLLFANDRQLVSVQNSLLIGFLTTFVTTVISLPLAIITAKWEFKGKGLLSGLILVPMVMPPFVGAIGVQRFFANYGSVNLLLMKLGIISEPISWFGGSGMLWMVVVLEALNLYPIMYLNLSAALSNVDPSLEEMASTLGAKKFKIFKDIMWPLSRPGYFAGAIIIFIWAMTDLGTPLLVGFNETISVKIFTMVMDINENPVGFAMVFLVIFMTVTIFLISKLFVSGKKYQMMAKGHVTSRSRPATGFESVCIYIVMISVVVLALIPHISVFTTSISDNWFMTILPEHFTTRYYELVFKTELAYKGVVNSLFYASLSTTLDVILGLMVAYVVVRKLIPFANLLDSLVMIPLALPGIVIAFGYVVTYTGTSLDPMENPVPLLVIAFGIRRLPYMVRAISSALQQIHVSLEEASETFGASRFYTLRKVTVPLVVANIIAGCLLCFAYAMLDVSDGLILAMKDKFYPLTKAIYALFQENGNGDLLASALGIIQIGILAACILSAAAILGKKMGELFRSG